VGGGALTTDNSSQHEKVIVALGALLFMPSFVKTPTIMIRGCSMKTFFQLRTKTDISFGAMLFMPSFVKTPNIDTRLSMKHSSDFAQKQTKIERSSQMLQYCRWKDRYVYGR
jgi:hypothetical protein